MDPESCLRHGEDGAGLNFNIDRRGAGILANGLFSTIEETPVARTSLLTPDT